MQDFYSWLKESTENELSREELHNIAMIQRGDPEHAMLRVQRVMGGGVLNEVVEHVGDLIHRMCERATYNYAGYDYVKNKVEKTIKWLTRPYGFRKEFNENIKNNYQYFIKEGMIEKKGWKTEADYRQAIINALKAYAEAHKKIPVHNETQLTARNASVAVGEMHFEHAVKELEKLKKWLDEGEEAWVKRVHRREF